MSGQTDDSTRAKKLGERTTLTLGGVTIPVEFVRPSTTTPSGIVVFVHGQGAVPSVYGIRTGPFVGRGFVFCHYRNRGHGGTRGTYSYVGSARDAFAVADHVGRLVGMPRHSPVHVIAHSSAALGVLRLIMDGGCRPSALALVSPTLTRRIFEHNANFVRPLDSKSGFEAWMDELNGDRGAIGLLRGYLSDPKWIYHPERLDGALRRQLEGAKVTWAAFDCADWTAVFDDWFSILPWGHIDWPRVGLPVITLLGEEDDWIPMQETASIVEQFGAAKKEVVRVKGGDHLLRGEWRELGVEIARFFADAT